MKCEIWVKGKFATYDQVKAEFLLNKEPVFNYSTNKQYISKIFYVDANDAIYQFDW
jgi:hypothetical protein